MIFDEIPEDLQPSYECECGGNIIKTNPVSGLWECDTCDWNENKAVTPNTENKGSNMDDEMTLIKVNLNDFDSEDEIRKAMNSAYLLGQKYYQRAGIETTHDEEHAKFTNLLDALVITVCAVEAPWPTGESGVMRLIADLTVFASDPIWTGTQCVIHKKIVRAAAEVLQKQYDILATIEFALENGATAAEILDENSPLRDAMHDLLGGEYGN
jgi:hypothetical protein